MIFQNYSFNYFLLITILWCFFVAHVLYKELLVFYIEGDEDIKNDIIEVLYEYYRRTGFPHEKLTDEQKTNRMERVIKSKDILLEEDVLQINPQGLDLANFYHPHMMKAFYTNRKDISPYAAYINDDKLKNCIKRWLDLGEVPSPVGIRRILKTRNGVRSVTNFKPTISKFIYDTYTKEGDMVLDPCAGYSGRLVGCIAANKNLFYHGIDPDGRTATGNMRMAGFFMEQRDSVEYRWKFKFRFDLGCAEDVMLSLEDGSYNLVFSSPPYWNVEKYSTDSNQSYLRYPKYDSWRDNFLGRILTESVRVVKDGGYIAFNVKNYKKAPIADDLCKIAENLGLRLAKTYQMRLANSEF
ncbi:hypothetical protein LCGC14_2845790, partial [marine sediment metagenome]